MGLSDLIKGQFIDVIEHVSEGAKLLVYKYSRQGDEIKQGAQLIVREGQMAVFVFKGQITDILGPGSYTINTGNLPILSSLEAVPHLFNSPIKSDLYFLDTTQFINNEWETENPIIKRDQELGIVRITAKGTYSFRIVDPALFMREVFGARRMSLTYDIIQYLNSMVAEAIVYELGNNNQSVIDLATQYRQLAEYLTPVVNMKANSIGIAVVEAIVEHIGVPEEVEKLIDEQSGIGLANRDMDTFIQYQSARAIRDAAKQKGGLAGLGAGAVVGKMVAESMDKSLNDQPDQDDPTEKLLKYKSLLDQGILTQEEFNELKKKLIDSI